MARIKEQEIFVNPYVVQMDKFAESLQHLSKTFLNMEHYKGTLSKEEIDEMFDKVTGNVCAGCERQEVCLGVRREKTYQMMYEIMCAAEEYGATYNYYAKYDAGFTDSALGSTVAGTFYDEGANVVFADAGVVGDGITAKAKELGKLAIQTDANLDAQQPGHVLTSVLKITGVPVKTITKAYAEGKIDEMDRFQTYNLASGATGITDLEEMGKHVQNQEVWNEIKEKVQAVSDKISSGEIKVTNKQLNEEFDESTCPNVVIKTN